MVSRASKRAWRRVAAGLFLLPALAEGGNSLRAQMPTDNMPAPSINRPMDSAKEDARLLLKQGRIYLQANDAARAKQCAELAQKKTVKWEFYEDTPEKLLADIGALPGSVVQPVSAVSPTTVSLPAGQTATRPAAPTSSFPADAHQIVKMGRDAFKAGNLDLAKECGNRANATSTRWGLFEDSPSKLLNDVAKAKAEKDKQEADKLLVAARVAFNKREYDKAAELAHKAQRLHGPYSMWDLGDRPEKVLAEVDAAKLRNRKPTLPPPPSATATASNSHVPGAAPKTEMPALTAIQTLGTSGAPAAPVTLAMTPIRQAALALMIEVRTLEKAGNLIEARNKAVAAQRLNADFAPGEDRPEVALMELNQMGVRKINEMIGDALAAAGAQPTTASASLAQTKLNQAKQFALGMGLDTFAIDEKASWLAQVVSAGMKPVAPAIPVAMKPEVMKPEMVKPVVDPKAAGRDMLAKANLELRNGQTEAARKLAEEVFSGPFDMRSEAMALMRNIEVEERNQKILAANRAYDAAMAAFTHGDYNQSVAIFLQIDGTLLTNDKRSSMKEKMQQAGSLAQAPKMPGRTESMPRPQMTSTIQTVSLPGKPIPGGDLPGTARVSDQPNAPTGPALPPLPPAPAPTPATVVGGPTLPPLAAPSPTQEPTSPGFAQQMKALQQVEFQKQRSDSLKVQREAQARFTKGETDAAIQLLTEQLAKLKDSQLDPADLAMIQRPLEYRLQTFKVLKSQKDAETTIAVKASNSAKVHAEAAMERDAKQKQVTDLMKQYRSLYDNGKFEDAMLLAMKAQELDQDSEAPRMAVEMARIQKRVKEAERLKANKEDLVLKGLNDTDDEGPALTIHDPIQFDKHLFDRAKNRESELHSLGTHTRTEREQVIERHLSTPITFDFNGIPLRQVLQDLRSITKLNVVPSLEALKDENISLDQSVSLKVEAIPLKSALNLLLRQVRLTYVIADDVLQVTTERAAKGRQVRKVYSVADLVIPIDNYAIPNSANLLKVLEENSKNRGFRMQGTGPAGMSSGQPTGTSSLSTVPGLDPKQQTLPAGPMAASTTQTFAKNTIEDVLIKLITNTVEPQTWNDMGGSGTIDYFPIGMALVINQTPDIQEQVAELLAALRRLQDMEVAVEVRIITVAETFFERIGLDFSMNIKTDKYTTTYEPQIVSGQFKPAGYINDFSPKHFISGLTPAGTFTNDLDIPIKSTSFNRAIPPFGYPNSPGNNGGLSLGLAFLNDIQVFMFMEAAQGDNRTNVMQAPKLTLFNGQTSTLLIQDFQFFVTDVAVVSVNGQLVFVPNNVPFPVGPAQTAGNISLAIQAVVSADRRYVRMNLNPQLQNLGSATVPLFPITTFITPTFEGGFTGQPIPFTQFIQQPKFASANILTTVAVPDGGTVLLGGLKHLSEGRNESGPPVLSKIPYVNRLFKNTGYGREAESMMIMVTPRIIINAEESERQTGYPEYLEQPPQ